MTAPPDRTAALEALRVLVAALTQSARTVEANTGITNAQLFLLRQLAQTDELSINELAVRAQTGQNSVSSVVGRLVSAGLVRKVRSAVDARRVALSLTRKGRAVVARAPMAPTEELIAALAALSTQEVRRLVSGLHSLIAALDLDLASAPMLFEQPRGRPQAGRG